MSWTQFLQGMSKGFEKYIEVVKGDENLLDAMKDIKGHFESDSSEKNEQKYFND